MTLPLEKNPNTNAQNSISMAEVNVELFFEPNTPISLNQITVRNLFQKPDDQTKISLWDGFGKSNIGKPKNPVFTVVTQVSATVSWGASEGICNKYTVTVKDAETDSIIYGTPQNFTTLPLALTANLTELYATPIISAAGNPTATTYNNVAGFAVAFTYSTYGSALTSGNWYRISGNSNTAFNKVVQVISSTDATHAVLFYPGTTPGAFGSGTTSIMKINVVSAVGMPTAVAFNGLFTVPIISVAGKPTATTYSGVSGFSVEYTYSTMGSALITDGWYRIAGNSNPLYNLAVQVIDSVDATHATVFYLNYPGTYGINPTTIVNVQKVSAAGTPTATTYSGVSGFSVAFTYSIASSALIANSWYRVEGNSNSLYNRNVRVIASADTTSAVLFYPGTTPGVFGSGTTTIMKIETFAIDGSPISPNVVEGYSVEYTYSSLGFPLTVGDWYRIEGNSNQLYNSYAQVISSANNTHASLFYLANPGAYGTGTTTIVDDSKSNNAIFKVQTITAAGIPKATTYGGVSGFSVAYTYLTFGGVLAANSWCLISGNSNVLYNKYVQVISSADTFHAIVFYPTNPGLYGSGTTTIKIKSNYTVHLLASNTAITPLPTAETFVDLLTLDNVPLTPVTPTVIVISKNTLTITSNATYATSYDIYEVISSTDTLIASDVQVPYNHTVGTYTLHTYKVKGRSSGGTSPYSAASLATRSLPDFPVAATNVSYGTLSNITAYTVAISWTRSTTVNFTNQRLRVLLHSDNTVAYTSGLVATNIAGLTTTDVLQAATVYDAYVDTINEAGVETSLPAVSFTTKTAKPAVPTANATSQTSITVTWGITTGADSYVLYKDSVSLGTKTSPFIDDTGITAYTLHSYQVAAVNVSGESEKSDICTERSWPELPVVVTGIVLTPDMNSIAIAWTKAATTPIRTVDNYQVYAYLTSDMSQVYNSGLLPSGSTSTVTDSTLLGWTAYTIKIWTINRAGSVVAEATMTTLPDSRPDPLTGTFPSITNVDPGTVNLTTSTVTIGTFQPNYNAPGISITSSNGQFQTGTSELTTGWVTTATVIPDPSGNIRFQARMNASSLETHSETSTFYLGGTGGTRTLTVTTRDPNPPTNVTATGNIGTATISWTNLGYTYIVTADTGQTKTVSNVSSVVLGDLPSTRLSGNRTFYVYARNIYNGTSSPSSASAYVTPMPQFSYRRGAASIDETGGSVAASFIIDTINVSNNSTYNWSLSGVSVADFVSFAYTSTDGAVLNMAPALSGSFTVYNNIAILSFSMAADHFTEGPETITFQLTGSPIGDFASSSISMVVNDTSLDPDLTVGAPIWNPAISYNNAYNTTPSTSGTVYGLEPSWPIRMSSIGGEISANNSTWGTTANGYTNASGEMTVYIRVSLGGTQRTSKSMEYQIESNNRVGWTAWTITDEYLDVPTDSSGRKVYHSWSGAAATVTVNNGYPNTGIWLYKTAGSIGNVNSNYAGNGTRSFQTFLDVNGYLNDYSFAGNAGFGASEWGTYTISASFNASGHTRSLPTMYAYATPVISFDVSRADAGTTININVTYGWPGSNISYAYSNTTGTAAWNGSLPGGPTWTLSSSRAYSFTNITIPITKWGNWTIAFNLYGAPDSNHADRIVAQGVSSTLEIRKAAPNATVTVGTIVAKNRSIRIPLELGTSTAGPAEGVNVYGDISGYDTNLGPFSYMFIGLTNGVEYKFNVRSYNVWIENDQSKSYKYGPASNNYAVTVVQTPPNNVITISSVTWNKSNTMTIKYTATASTEGDITSYWTWITGAPEISNNTATYSITVNADATIGVITVTSNNFGWNQVRNVYIAYANASGIGPQSNTVEFSSVPNEAIAISWVATTRRLTIDISNHIPSDTVSTTGTGASSTGMAAFMTTAVSVNLTNTGTTSYYYTIDKTGWGNWYVTGVFTTSSNTRTSNTIYVSKAAPAATITFLVANLTQETSGGVRVAGTVNASFTIGTNQGGPIEGYGFRVSPAGPTVTMGVGGNARITGLTDGTSYSYTPYIYNSDASYDGGPLSFTTVAPPVTISYSAGWNPGSMAAGNTSILSIFGAPNETVTIRYTLNGSSAIEWIPRTLNASGSHQEGVTFNYAGVWTWRITYPSRPGQDAIAVIQTG